MISVKKRFLRIAKIFCAVALLAVATNAAIKSARASDDPDELLNYSFAVWVGSGIYKVTGSDKRFAVLRAPFSYTFRKAQYDKERYLDRLGFKLLFPAVVALQEETDTNFTFGAAALVPGLEVQIPVNKYWTLKPFGQFGAGKDSAGGDVKYIYGGGARSLISFPWKKFKLGIGNSLILAEDRNAATDEKSGFSMWEAGLDVAHPIGLNLFNRDLDLGAFFVFSRFLNDVDFQEDGGDTERVNRMYTVGLTLGAAEPVSIMGFKASRVGMHYRGGPSGFRGIGFNMGFPF